MVGKNNHGVDREWMPLSHLSKRAAQLVDAVRQQRQPAVRQIDGEEKAASGDEIATVAVMRAGRGDGFRKGSTHPTGCFVTPASGANRNPTGKSAQDVGQSLHRKILFLARQVETP
jgi:hypothetical protein